MKREEPDVIALEKLMSHCGLRAKTPPEIKSYAALGKGSRYNRILKACGHYSLFSAAVSALYFFFKKTGIGISLTKALSAVVITASVSAGGYYTVKKITGEKTHPAEEKELKKSVKPGVILQRENGKAGDTGKKPVKALPGGRVSHYVLGIMPLQSGTLGESDLRRITGSVYGKVAAGKKKDFAKILNRRKIRGVRYAAFSSLEKIGGYYYVSVRVMDTGSTRIVFNTGRELNSLEDAEREFKLIYGEVVRLIEKRGEN